MSRRFDLAACAVLLALGVVVTTLPENPGGILATLLMPAVVLPVLLRRRAPVLAALAFLAGVALTALPTLHQIRCGFALPVALLLTFSTAEHRPPRIALAATAAAVAAVAVLGFTDKLLQDDPLGVMVLTLPLLAGAFAGGAVARRRDRMAATLRERTTELERRREQTAALAVEIERTRLASDLDAAARDAVREIVRLAAEGERDPSRERFARIEAGGRTALNEMRALLGALRSDAAGSREPRPTLAQLDMLLAEARVALQVEGDRRPLPDGVELAAYRAVQHALVAVRAPATVRLRYGADALELEVAGAAVADGRADAAVLAARERVAAGGGTVTVTPGVLRASLPALA